MDATQARALSISAKVTRQDATFTAGEEYLRLLMELCFSSIKLYASLGKTYAYPFHLTGHDIPGSDEWVRQYREISCIPNCSAIITATIPTITVELEKLGYKIDALPRRVSLKDGPLYYRFCIRW